MKPEKPTIKKNKSVKRKTEWPSLLFGWAFVLGTVLIIVYLIMNASPEGTLVCDTQRRSVSLTTFGTCHIEPALPRKKGPFFSFLKRFL